MASGVRLGAGKETGAHAATASTRVSASANTEERRARIKSLLAGAFSGHAQMRQHGRREEPRTLGVRDVGEVDGELASAARADREHRLRDLVWRADHADVRERTRFRPRLDPFDLALVLRDQK